MKVLTFGDLKAEKGISYSRQWIRKMVLAGRFPEPFEIGPHRLVWTEAAIDSWLAERSVECHAEVA
jgi:prophage regulatory protein